MGKKSARASMERLDEMLRRGDEVAPGERLTDEIDKKSLFEKMGISDGTMKRIWKKKKKEHIDEKIKKAQEAMEKEGPGADATRSEEEAKINEYFFKLGKEMDYRKTDSMVFHINGHKIEMQRVPDDSKDTVLTIGGKSIVPDKLYPPKGLQPGKTKNEGSFVRVSRQDYEEINARLDALLKEKGAPTFGDVGNSKITFSYKNPGRYKMAVDGSVIDDRLLHAGVKEYVTSHNTSWWEDGKDLLLDEGHEIKTGLGRHLGAEVVHAPKTISRSLYNDQMRNLEGVSRILGMLMQIIERNSQIR